VGTGRANPLAAILTGALLLRDLGYMEGAAAIELAVRAALRSGHTTPDLGGSLGTEEVGDRIAEQVRVAAAV
jgi:isocitrate/isopropylmalate dehydrogenase